MKVLIVDRSSVIRERLLKLLSRFKEIDDVILAGNEGELIAALQIYQPEIVIIDFSLPEGTVVRLFENLNGNYRDIRWIVLADYLTPAIQQKCWLSGVEYVFDKNSQFEKAIELIQTLLYA